MTRSKADSDLLQIFSEMEIFKYRPYVEKIYRAFCDEKCAQIKHLVEMEHANIHNLDEQGNPLFWRLKFGYRQILFLLADVNLVDLSVKNTNGYSLFEKILYDIVQVSNQYIDREHEKLLEYFCDKLPIKILRAHISFKDCHSKEQKKYDLTELLLQNQKYDLLDKLVDRGFVLPLPQCKQAMYTTIDDYPHALIVSSDFYLIYKANPHFIHLKNSKGENPIFDLVKSGVGGDNKANNNLNFLLEKNPNLLFDRNANQLTPLHFAASILNSDSVYDQKRAQSIFQNIILPALSRVEHPDYHLLDRNGQTVLHLLAMNQPCLWMFFYAAKGCHLHVVNDYKKIKMTSTSGKKAYFYYNQEIIPPRWDCQLVTDDATRNIDISNESNAIALLDKIHLLPYKQQMEEIKIFAPVLFAVIESYIELNDLAINTLSSGGSSALFYAINSGNKGAWTTLLSYGANPTLYGDPERNCFTCIDTNLRKLRASLSDSDTNKVQIRAVIKEITELREKITVGYAEKKYNEADFNTVIDICQQVKFPDSGYPKAQELMALALFMRAQDNNEMDAQKLRFLALPYYIKSVKWGNPTLLAMRDHALCAIYNLPNNTESNILNEKAEQFLCETRAASKIQKKWKQYQIQIEPSLFMQMACSKVFCVAVGMLVLSGGFVITTTACGAIPFMLGISAGSLLMVTGLGSAACGFFVQSQSQKIITKESKEPYQSRFFFD